MNRRMKDVKYSGIRKFFNEVKNYKDVISFTLGQPDFNVPTSIQNGIIKALNEGKTVYTLNQGVPELREKISGFLSREYKIDFSKDEIILTVGGSEAIFIAFSALFNEGDYVLIPNPGYPAYENILRFIGVKPVFYGVSPECGINFDDIKNNFETKKISGIVLCFPNNPTGISMSEQDKKQMHDILIEFPQCKIISDEIYSGISYEKFETICTYEDLIDRTILVSGFSKIFSMTGLRLGFMCAKQYYFDEIIKLHSYATSCSTSIVQYGTLYGFDEAFEQSKLMVREFEKRRNLIYDSLIKIGFDVVLPKGAFYVFPSLKSITNMDSYSFAIDLIKNGGVACVPGISFGDRGEGYLRISYCNSIEEIKIGVERIRNYLDMSKTKYVNKN